MKHRDIVGDIGSDGSGMVRDVGFDFHCHLLRPNLSFFRSSGATYVFLISRTYLFQTSNVLLIFFDVPKIVF